MSNWVAFAALIVLVIGMIMFIYQNQHRTAVPAVQLTPTAPPPLGSWPYYRGNPERNGWMPGPAPVETPIAVWTRAAGAPARFAPAVMDGTLYWPSEGAGAVALDADTGAVHWQIDAANAMPAAVDGIVYLLSADGAALVAYDATTAEELWRVAPGTALWTPLLVDGTLYYGGNPNLLVALDARTGEARWRSAQIAVATRSVALAGGILVVGAEDGFIYGIDQTTGDTRWSFATGTDGVIQTSAILDGMVYAGTFGGASNAFVALDLQTGEQRWRIDDATGAGYWAPGAADGLVFAPSDSGNLLALDAATGSVQWSHGSSAPMRSAPLIVDGLVYVGGDDGVLVALDVDDGAERWRFTLDGPVEFGPVAVDGFLYVSTGSGTLYALAEPASRSAGATPTPEPTPAAATGAPVAEFVWASSGDPNQPLISATHLAVAPNGAIWVVDGRADRIQILSPDGVFLETFGQSGAGPGEFNFRRAGNDPWGAIIFAPDGSFFVVDTGNNRVQKFDANRVHLFDIGQPGGTLGTIAKPAIGFLTPDDRLFVVGWHSNDLIASWDIFSAVDGSYLGSWPVEANAGTLAPDGFVWIGSADRSQVVRVDLDGRVRSTWGVPGSDPGEIARAEVAVGDGQGQVFVLDQSLNRVSVFDEGGGFIGLWGGAGDAAGQFRAPLAAALDGQGNIYIADSQNARVQKFKLLPPLAPAP